MAFVTQPPNPEITDPQYNTQLYIHEASLKVDDLFDNPVPIGDLYGPEIGQIDHPQVKILEGGITEYTTTYFTIQAMSKVRILKAQRPEHRGVTNTIPNVILTGATGTGSEGHNEDLAKQIAAAGCNVIFKGVPRYFGPRKALRLTEDANEMHGLLNTLASFKQLKLGSLESVYVYGESQAAMKLLGFIALSASYNREVVDGMAVALCYLEKAPYNNPIKLLSDWTSIVKSSINAFLHMNPQELWQAQKTFDIRDLLHHLGVIPVLMSGEAGKFLPHIPETQPLTNKLFGNDSLSEAVKTKARLDAHFPNMETSINASYGHVDGIIAPETVEARREFFKNAADVATGLME